MPNKIAHFFPFLLVFYQLSVLTLSVRHVDQKLGFVPDDVTGLVTRTLDKRNAQIELLCGLLYKPRPTSNSL